MRQIAAISTFDQEIGLICICALAAAPTHVSVAGQISRSLYAIVWMSLPRWRSSPASSLDCQAGSA